MNVILISSFFVHFVHRTTYKIQISPVVIEKNIIYFDSECHTKKIYEFLPLQTLSHCVFCHKYRLLRV